MVVESPTDNRSVGKKAARVIPLDGDQRENRGRIGGHVLLSPCVGTPAVCMPLGIKATSCGDAR